MKRHFTFLSRSGFTMAETLIVVAFLGLLMVVLLLNAKRQIIRGYDGVRKADIAKIRRAFEEYYNDHDCYPSSDILNNCGGNQLQPYMEKIPCDPTSRAPYLYVPVTSDACKGYRLCAALGDTSDPDIAAGGCNGITGCGWGYGYNYCISSGVSVTAPGFDPNATPMPTSTPMPTTPPGTPTNAPTPTGPGGGPGPWACALSGDCNNFGFPNSCPISFSDANTALCLSYCPTSPLILRCW